ncbi:hypothetical protein ACLMJK_006470 [Lecanora helva]
MCIDKSPDPFLVLVDIACDILDIDLTSKWSFQSEMNGNEIDPARYASDPRPAYALRWLLKKLQSDEGPYRPHQTCKAWLLLRELLVRTPMAAVARLIKEHTLINSLRRTIEWLYGRCCRVAKSTQSPDDQLIDDIPGDLFDPMESSFIRPNESRKRKRDEDKSPPASPLYATKPYIFRRTCSLFTAVCGVFAQLDELASDECQKKGFVVEHLRFAMKSSLEEAAIILGKSLYITNQILRSAYQSSFKRTFYMNWAKSTETPHIMPLIDFWSSRHRGTEEISGDSCNRAFRTHCMLSCLQLLLTCREWSKHMVQDVEQKLEKLLILHVTLPFRTQSLASQRPHDSKVQEPPSSFKDNLISTLEQYTFPRPEEGVSDSLYETERSASKTRNHLIVSFISLLFRVANTSRPRKTPAQRRIEDQWLEKMFTCLTESAAVFLPHASSTEAHRDYVRSSKWMLQQCVEHEVKISLPTLKAILDQVSGLFSDNNGRIEWEVIRLCLQLDANICTFPASGASRDTEYGYQTPNKYLSILLSRITIASHQRSIEDNKNCGKQSQPLEIASQLFQAFSNARDLTGFLGHWRDQLEQGHKKKVRDDEPCIWEDDELSKFVSTLVGNSLTATQIEDVLATTIRKKPFKSTSDLVIIDCVVAGIVEENFTLLSTMIWDVFRVLTTLLEIPSDEGSNQRWRCWRALAVISNRWTSPHESAALKSDFCTLLERAHQLIENLPDWNSSKKVSDFTETLHASRFMLDSLNWRRGSPYGIRPALSQKTMSAVEKLLNVMDQFCNRIKYSFFDTAKAEEIRSKSPDVEFAVGSVESLYIKCMSYITSQPGLLCHFDEILQLRLIEQLYWCAVHQQRTTRSSMESSIDYGLPWETLTRCDTNDLGSDFSKHLRNFQVQRFLDASRFSDPKCWEIRAIDYAIAFKAIKNQSPRYLERRQRSSIANHILRIVMHINIPTFELLIDHLVILIKMLTIPNSEMVILSDTGKAVPHQEGSNELTLITLTRQLDGRVKWTTDDIQAVEVLQRLASAVMSYLFSTLDRSRSVECLGLLYEELAKLLEQKFNGSDTLTPARSAVIEVSLNAYSQHRHELPDPLIPVLETLDKSRLYHLEIILRSIENTNNEQLASPETRHHHGVNLELLVGYSDLLITHPQLSQFTYNMAHNYSYSRLTNVNENPEAHWFDADYCSRAYLKVRAARLELVLGLHDVSLHPSVNRAADLLENPLTKRQQERNYLSRNLQSTVSLLEPHRRKELIGALGTHEGKPITLSELHLLKMIAFSIGDQEMRELRPALSTVLIHLCTQLSASSEPRESLITMQCIHIFLQKHPRIISQENIDSLFTAITAKANRLETNRNDENSPTTYLGLCRLFSTVLNLHRSRIRYHILLLALQSLLRCLFAPYTISSPDVTQVLPSTLTTTHASAFSRLLTTLADPTVSSVARSKKNRSHHDLNDEVKKARSIAGQHLWILIAEYCAWQLKGRLTPEMKGVLETGLFAVLDVTEMKIMRTLNAWLEEDQREVWKVLYEDWKRARRKDTDSWL